MPAQRYSYTAITLHWLLALLLAFQIALGQTLEGSNSPELFTRYQLHKSVGITILLFSLARLAVRLATPRPPASEGQAWTRSLAAVVHWLFYLVLILGPITGWLLVSTAKIQVPTLIFGIIRWPHLPVGHGWHEPAEVIHGVLARLAIALFALHIIGALRHQWLLGKPELQRMIPFARGKAAGAAIGALALVGATFVAGQTIYPERTRLPAQKASPTPAVAPAAATIAPTAKDDETAATEAAKNTPEDAAQPLADWTVAPGGRLGFTARWNGEAVDGRFSRWRAAIRFSPDELAKSTIRVTVDLASIDTGDGQRDDSLKSSDFFDVGSHPSAVFTARDIRHLGGDRYEARGTLDLHGVSKPTTVRFTLRIDGDKARVSGTAGIDRTAFGVGQGEWAATDAIAAGVDIAFSFNAARPASKPTVR